METKNKVTEPVNNERVIYRHSPTTHKIGAWIYILLTTIQMGMVVLLLLLLLIPVLGELPIYVLYFIAGILGVLIAFLFLERDKRLKTSYEIFEDRLEFFSARFPMDKEIIKVEDIVQVRYEDDFGRAFNGPRAWFIYCYMKTGHEVKLKRIKKERFMLPLLDDDRINRTIQILKFFQRKKKQVFISTRHKEINQALNLKNWTKPEIF